jgi:hypothetical protein
LFQLQQALGIQAQYPVTFAGGIVNNSSSAFTCTHATFNATGTNQNLSGSGAYLFSGTVLLSSN